MHGCSTDSSSNDKREPVTPKSEPSCWHQSGRSETETTEGHNNTPTSIGSTRSFGNDHEDGPQNPVSRRRQADEQINENETTKWRRLDRSITPHNQLSK